MALTGAATVGALLAGLVGEVAGPRAALWMAAVVLAGVWVPILCSPLRTMRTLATEGPVAIEEPVATEERAT